jgi:hypothetical protein
LTLGNDNQGNSSATGAAVFGAVGGLAALAAVALVIFFMRRKKSQPDSMEMDTPAVFVPHEDLYTAEYINPDSACGEEGEFSEGIFSDCGDEALVL